MKRILFSLLLTGTGSLALAACGSDVNGPGSTALSCGFGTPTVLAAGEVLQVSGVDNQACLSAGDAQGEFLYIPFYGRATPNSVLTGDDQPVTLSVEVTGGGLAGGGGAPLASTVSPTPMVSLSRTAARPIRDTRFEAWLRRREIDELAPKIRPGPTTAAVREPVTAADVPSIGELVQYNVAISCEGTEQVRTGRVMYVSDHAVVVADTSNPTDLTPGDYAYFGVTFDTLVYPVETANFGTPTDIDGNGRSILFFTTAVNARNSHGAESVVIGFFWSGDLFPDVATPRLQACPGGNDAEMFYLIAPDPDGEVGVPFTLADVRDYAIPLIGHEYQHLINASRRLFVNNASKFEDSWLNEGLSHIAEELLFYEVTGLQSGQNLDIGDIRASGTILDAFNEYMAGNFNNFADYLSEPDTASLMGIDNLATRGATWAFLRYAADRSGRSDDAFFFDLVNGTAAGVDNLNDVLGAGETLDWMADWTVSVYGDDFVAGLDPRYGFASWDLRSLYENSSLESYPLAVQTLTSGVDRQMDLLTGGAAYLSFTIDPDTPGVIHVESEGATPPAQLRGSFLRVR